MSLTLQWQRARSYAIVGAWVNEAYLDDMEFTTEDIPETLLAAGWLGAIWSPQLSVALGISTTPLVVLEAAALTGLAASVAIGGVEGGAMYIDYITNPTEIFTKPEKTEVLLDAHRITMAVVTLGGSELGRVGTNLILNFTDEIFKNRYRTGPYLTF